ncbi:MAG: glycerophosphoryl diester phosphodiesterase membrane domain-containing protein [Promethearchaeota archaeon]
MVTTSDKYEYKSVDFGQVLETSLRYWIKNLKSYWLVLFLIQLAVISVAYGAFFLSGGNMFVGQIAGSLGAVIPFWLPAWFLPTLLAYGLIGVLVTVLIINFVIQALLGGMIVRHTADHHAQLMPTLSSSYNHTKTRFWSLIGAQILIGLIMFGLIFGMLFLAVFLGVGLLFVIGIFGLIGLLVAVVVMAILVIYIGVRFAVVTPAVILGGESAAGSLSRSWNLVSRNWWRVFGITLLISLISIIVGLPTSIVSSMITFSLFNPSILVVAIIAYSIVSAVMAGITGPLGTTTATMIYHDLMGRQFGAPSPAELRQKQPYAKCPVCGTPASPGDRFCEKCGRQLDIE